MHRDSDLQRAMDIIRRKRAYIFSRYLPHPTNDCRPQDIRNVLVIIGASRSGSSLLYHLLSGHPDMLAPHGEEITLYKLAGLGLISHAGDSHAIPDDLPAERADRAALARDILCDSGYPGKSGSRDFPVDRYLVDSAQRLLLQWPQIDFDCDRLYQTAQKALNGHLHANAAFDTNLYWLDLLSALIAQGLPINPYYYDLPRELVHQRHPSIPRSDGPPFSSLCLEEPPFIVPRPKLFSGPGAATGRCLLLKSSSNCYRLEFMKSLYPQARFSFIYLTRNPAAVINGLMDGWLSSGFYSQNLAGVTDLDIAGYTARERPWSRHWWNFDAPPGWSEYTRRPLEQVCGFQWWSANKHVIDGIDSGAINRYMVIKYEDLLDHDSMRAQLAKAFDFAGLPQDAVLNGFKAPAAVMAVNPPGARKWMQRGSVILPAIRDGRIASVARSLNYDVNAADGFV